MAGQAHRGTRAPGRSSRAASSPVVVGSGAASGATLARTTRPSEKTIKPGTRATYRTLLLRGLDPDEAANLTAYVCGIQVGSQWKLDEVNRLLFLRELELGGRFGAEDGTTEPT